MLLSTASSGYGQPQWHQASVGMHRIQIELATDQASREIGLMGRQNLDANHGMLFVFERSAVHCFWMKNTPLPLSIAFIDKNKRIVSIGQGTPYSLTSICPKQPVRFVLEMHQGWFARHGYDAGTLVNW